MLESFFVRDFRLFKHLELPQLGRVNLIAGKNGSGKSALLEAIHLYASNGNPRILADQIIERQEFGDEKVRNSGEFEISHPLCHIFSDRKMPQLGDNGVLMGILNTQFQVQFTLGAFKEEINRKDSTIYHRRITEPQQLPEQKEDIDWFIFVEEEGTLLNALSLRTYSERYFDPRNTFRDPLEKARFEAQYVPAQSIDEDHIALLWDEVSLTDQEIEVIQGIQIVNPEVSGLNFVNSSGENRHTGRRIAIVKLQSQSLPIPLKSLGDGIYRLLYIILALVNAKDGILLIDELENGLHWKIHPKVWDVIFCLSEKLNVQVFATTHSGDCIRGFESAWGEHQDAGTFFRLDVKDDNVKATYYNHEILHDAIVADVEVR